MQKISLKNKKKRQVGWQGFMMIEAAFSIFIVGTILITFMAVMGSVFRTEFAKRDLIIATNLAQEGIEIVRNIRDNNWKATPPKTAFDIPSFVANGNDYCFGYGGGIGHGCSALRIDANNFYGYGAGTETKFFRTIEIAGAGDSRTIKSRVTWDGKSIEMTDILYAWGDPE